MGGVSSLALSLLLLALLTPTSGVSSSRFLSQETNNGKCERITIPMCMEMKYNMTIMPNLVGHADQKDAVLQLNEFIPLVQVGSQLTTNCIPITDYAVAIGL